jgi:hypothetical protein
MTERTTGPEIKVTKENLQSIRGEIASLRERKGENDKTLQMIRWARGGAEAIGAHEDVVDLYWEEYLIGKHIIMEARDQEGLWSLPLKAKDIAKGFLMMRNSALKAEDYIQANEVESKRARSGRFLGETSMLQRNYKDAVKHFRNSVEIFKRMENWRDRVNGLEISGFLAEAMILSGRIEEGIGIARKTFLSYDKGDWELLKKEDYYTWAVWKSGCVIKAWHALLARGVSINEDLKDGMVDMLVDGEEILRIPEGEETWGDKDFSFRKSEILAIKKALKLED